MQGEIRVKISNCVHDFFILIFIKYGLKMVVLVCVCAVPAFANKQAGQLRYGENGQLINNRDDNPRTYVDHHQKTKEKTAGKWRIGWGLGYGFDWRKSNLRHIAASNATSGIDHKYSAFVFTQYVLESQLFFEVPIIISYVAPDIRYFSAYYNNTGDGYHIDLSFLAGYYLLDTQSIRFSMKGGLGYGFGYIWQTRFRLNSNNVKIEDSSSVVHNALIFRMGVEIGYLKHSLGLLLNYYPWSGEFAKLYSQPPQSGITPSDPMVSNVSNHYASSFGMNMYYTYRF